MKLQKVNTILDLIYLIFRIFIINEIESRKEKIGKI
jgi:hypothetical protein